MVLQIRQERERRKWTLEDVAKNIGVSKAAVHDIETGRRHPSYKVLVKLENLFGKSHRQLFAVVDETNLSSK